MPLGRRRNRIDRSLRERGVPPEPQVRELRRRVSRRLARAIPGAAPFLLGAALSGRANRRSTETLARRIRDDLRQGPRPWDVRG